ncbi:STAS domain-containing protein [Streptomyces odontomachi]|uniref:STAS domain-containing protein n=1 Tax=Streptomyces odontomachi TaxID=2944940 RepID=UPI0027E3A70A|nr:STAS domain-containing protein [Streptomyces sp. ODS25]
MRTALPHGLPAVDPMASPALILPAVVGPDGLARLCGDVRARLAVAGCGVVLCDARALGGRGLAAVDLLARLELTARRAGGHIRLRHPPPDLPALLLLTGLSFEVERQAEGREEPGGVQEGGEPGDPAG